MSQQRSRAVARRRAKVKGRDHDRASRRDRIERMLGLVGLKDRPLRPGDKLLDLLCRRIDPKPRVVPDTGHPRDRDLAARAKDLQGRLDKVAIKIGGDELSFNDYHSVCTMLLSHFNAGTAHPSYGESYRAPADVIKAFFDRHDLAMWDVYRSSVLQTLAEASCIDTGIYTARQEFVPHGSRLRLTTVVGRTDVPSRTIVADGVGRRAYRCGGFDALESGEVEWVEWDAGALGLGASGRLPVYVQSHALHQIRHRLAIKPGHFIDYSLWRSLAEPVLLPAHGGAYLVEYRIRGHKLGYLVAEPLGDVVLVRTFLLVTMQGTPEGTEFSRRLRLCRPDIEYLRFDRLGTFVVTDLARDPEIAGLLRSCGCGGALDFAAHVDAGVIAEGYAARFRARMGPALTDISSRYLGASAVCIPP